MHSAVPLGRLLVTSGLLTQQALDEVLSLQKTDGRRLGELLAEKGLVRPHQLAQFLSHQLACPWVSLQRVEVAREAVDILPRELAWKHHMVPIHLRTSRGATALYVAMDDPTDDAALSEASNAATMTVKPMVALASEIRTLLERLYGGGNGSAASPEPRGPTGTLPPEATTPVPSPAKLRPPSVPVARSPSAPSPPNPSPSNPSPSPPPAIVVKDEKGEPGSGTTKTVSRPPKPPPPKGSAPPPVALAEPSFLEEIELIEVAPGSSRTPGELGRSPPRVVVAGDPEDSLVERIRTATSRLPVEVIAAPAVDLRSVIGTDLSSPVVLVVSDETYAAGRSDLERLGAESSAQLVIATRDARSGQLERLIDDSVRRWRRTSYEKGRIIDGRYELLRDLGGRIAGSRWEVRHLKTNRRSLLKIGVQAAHDDTDADAVRREHLSLARVQHPGAVDLRDAGSTDSGDPYVVVEMLEGRTLEGLVVARGALGPPEACALMRQLADVLAASHKAGVLHHEVRPEHVLVVRDPWGVERVKLVHWESATVGDGNPEAAVDLAGLGACAFLALVGRHRNDGEDVRDVPLAPTLATVIAHAIGGAHARRFGSAREFIEALEEAAPRRRDSMALLRSAPEKRGASVKPVVPPVAPPSVPSPTSSPIPGAAPSLAREAPATLPDANELRRFVRAPYRTPVRVEVPGLGAVDGRSEDISEGGLFVVTRGKIADGSPVTVRFALPIDGKVVSEPGTVRWSRATRNPDGSEPRAIGIELASPSAEVVRQIARYVSFMAVDLTPE